jgi:integral membrane sensor domain MASE1
LKIIALLRGVFAPLKTGLFYFCEVLMKAKNNFVDDVLFELKDVLRFVFFSVIVFCFVFGGIGLFVLGREFSLF